MWSLKWSGQTSPTFNRTLLDSNKFDFAVL